MKIEDAMDYIRCALNSGCSQVCNTKYRGECTDELILEAVKTVDEALKELEKYREFCDLEDLPEIEQYLMI